MLFTSASGRPQFAVGSERLPLVALIQEEVVISLNIFAELSQCLSVLRELALTQPLRQREHDRRFELSQD